MAAESVRLTKRTVDAVKAPENGELRVWDRDVKGFFLRVYPSGRKVYAVKYRVGSAQRVHTIGVHGSPYTPEMARDAADLVLRRVKDGLDPAAEKREARAALTVASLIDRYLGEGPATKPAKRASTWQIDASNLNRHIRPLLGRRIANDVSKSEAARAVRDIAAGKTAADIKTGSRGRARVTGGEGTARRTRTTAAAMFSWGIEHGLVKTNPFASVKLPAARGRERFLSRDEAVKLLEALAALEKVAGISSGAADAIRLLLFTGARKTEVLGLALKSSASKPSPLFAL